MLIAVSLVLLVCLLCYWLCYSLCYLLCHCCAAFDVIIAIHCLQSSITFKLCCADCCITCVACLLTVLLTLLLLNVLLAISLAVLLNVLLVVLLAHCSLLCYSMLCSQSNTIDIALKLYGKLILVLCYSIIPFLFFFFPSNFISFFNLYFYHIIIIILNRPHTHPNTILLISVLLSNIVKFRNHRLALMLADGDVSGVMSRRPIETWGTANCKPTDDVVSFWFPLFGQNITLNYTITPYYLKFYTLNQSIGYIFSWL